MTRCSVQPRDRIVVKGYWFVSFAKIVARSIGKSTGINLSRKHSQKHFDHAKQSATDALKTASKMAIQKTAGATVDLIGNRIADKITRVLKISPQNNSEENIEHDGEIHRERYISPEKRQKIIDDLRLI